MMLTRTLTKFRATAYDVKADLDAGTAEIQKIADVTFMGTSATSTDARRAFTDQGYTIARGTKIKIEELEKTVYGCSIEDFLEIASPIEQNDENDK